MEGKIRNTWKHSIGNFLHRWDDDVREKRSRLPAPWWPLCIKRAHWLGWLPFQIQKKRMRTRNGRIVQELKMSWLRTFSYASVSVDETVNKYAPWSKIRQITFYREHVYTQELRERVISREMVIHFSHTKCDFQYGSDSSKVTICPLPRQKCFSWRGDHWGKMGQAMDKPHVVHYELRHSNSTTDITTEGRRPKEKSFSSNSSFAIKDYMNAL